MRRLRGSTGDALESAGGSPRRRPTRTTVVVIAGVALLAVLIGLVLVFTGNDGTEPAAGAAAPTTSPATTTAATTSPSAAPTGGAAKSSTTPNPDGLPPALPAVPLDGTAKAGDGVTATLPRIEEIQGSGTGPGNISGPSLRVTVRMENGTHGPMPLDSVAVNVYYGDERTPASPLDDPSSAPFQGTLARGKSAQGVYVVRVPESARGDVTVELGYRAGSPLILFRGAVD